MNGLIYGLTNVASSPDQFIRLDANGLLMGSGYFDATWMIPADKNYDRFLLNAHLRNLDLTGLNRMITPLAPARISNGYAQDIFFNIDATSKGATVDMIFPYNNLKIDILNAEDGSRKKIASYLLNKIIKSDNPSARSPSKYREYNLYVERNPYHSTFNYFWQILQPPLAESVGVSKKKQNLAKSISNVVSGIKKLFGRSADSKKNNETDRMDKGSTE